MPDFYVNKNPQPTGEHEVHEKGVCPHPPDISNRLDLGWHASCHGAVIKARTIYSNVDGCYWCCNACHTR
jgi:hypothetical protein